jgi:hypothetical protein
VNTLPRNKVTDALGVTTALAGALLVAAIVIPADPLGRVIGALIVASIAVGLAGLVLHRVEFPSGSMQRGPRSGPVPRSYPEGPLARWTARDATAWAFEESAPDFAPIISLTEARVARRRSEPERREVTTA